MKIFCLIFRIIKKLNLVVISIALLTANTGYAEPFVLIGVTTPFIQSAVDQTNNVGYRVGLGYSLPMVYPAWAINFGIDMMSWSQFATNQMLGSLPTQYKINPSVDGTIGVSYTTHDFSPFISIGVLYENLSYASSLPANTIGTMDFNSDQAVVPILETGINYSLSRLISLRASYMVTYTSGTPHVENLWGANFYKLYGLPRLSAFTLSAVFYIPFGSEQDAESNTETIYSTSVSTSAAIATY